MTRVHIKISDEGWILERLASELANRLPYVSFDTERDVTANIQYYMTYGCRQDRVSDLEVALFTHRENLEGAAAQFDAVADEVDVCVAMSNATADILRLGGDRDIETISPGVDLERFTPKVKIGVVGRTYHTGRKGESLVADVMDIPGIDWHFTGSGWPGESQPVSEADLPDFYRSLDYLLVPSLIEGGPMPVLEALASGCKVIGAPVGWVPEFPHIGFQLGDSADLRRVLTQVVQEKQALAESVQGQTWDRWATLHDQLFSRMLGGRPVSTTDLAPPEKPLGDERVTVVVHGQEMGASKGGPSVRAPRTALELQRFGVNARFAQGMDFGAEDSDLVHVFNVWQPAHCARTLQQASKQGLTSVLSTIFLDLSTRPTYEKAVREALASESDPEELFQAMDELRDQGDDRPPEVQEPYPGYHEDVRALTEDADHLILLSEHERALLADIGVNHPSTSVVKNPVDVPRFAGADPQPFRELIGADEYVLCVGRIESRKNQAMLAAALQGTEIPLVFIGHEPDPAYAELLRKWSGPNVIMAGRFEPDDPMLASALAGARVFCLPSWSEGAPLSALEAAAAGCSLVLSNRSSEREYFGSLARYVDPADPRDMRSTLIEAFAQGRNPSTEKQQTALLHRDHTWEAYTKETVAAYAQALERKQPEDSRAAVESQLFLDVTTLANHQGPLTGISRVEDSIAVRLPEGVARFVVWNWHRSCYVEVSKAAVVSRELAEVRGPLADYVLPKPGDETPSGQVDFRPGDKLVVLGSGWMRNPTYLQNLADVKAIEGITLVVGIYDVLQYKFRYLYPEASVQFIEHVQILLKLADYVLTCSESSRADIEDFAHDMRLPIPPVHVLPMGDELGEPLPGEYVQQDVIDSVRAGGPFVLYVSSLDVRKNHKLLLDVWRELKLRHRSGTPRLVLVGRIGWGGEAVLDELKMDEKLHDIVLLHDVNDQTLAQLYRDSLFTVYPSFYEGWGLPVSESLQHGKVCIASDGGSLKEVGLGHAPHLDPRDFKAWYREIEKYAFSKDLRQRAEAELAQYSSVKWTSTVQDLLAVVQDVETTQALARIRPGVTYRCTETAEEAEVQGSSDEPSLSDEDSGTLEEEPLEPADPFLVAGWGEPEQAGRWTLGTTAVICCSTKGSRDSGHAALLLHVEGVFSPTEEPVWVDIVVNDSQVDSVSLYDAGPLVIPLTTPRTRDWVVKLLIRNPQSPADDGESQDERKLGLLVSSLSIASPTELDRGWQEVDGTHGVHTIRTSSAPEPSFLCAQLDSDDLCQGSSVIDGREGPVMLLGGRSGHQYVARWGRWNGWHTVSLETDKPCSITNLGVFRELPPQVLADLSGARSVEKSRRSLRHARIVTNAPALELGQDVLLVADSPLLAGLSGDWFEADPGGLWAGSDPATISFRTPAISSDKVRIRLNLFSAPGLPATGVPVQVLVGTEEMTTVARGPDAAMTFEAVVPTHRLRVDDSGTVAVTVESGVALAPAAAGMSEDYRKLGVMVASIRLEEA